MLSYYVCKVISFPELGSDRKGITIEVVDCNQPTLNKDIFNRCFFNRELAEDYVKKLDNPELYVIVYYPGK
jgi:hypothetical protein